MAHTTFCAIDFETANGSRASVCAVGLVRVDAATGRVLHAGGGLVRPPAGHDTFLPQNTRIHGILADQVTAAPRWPEVMAWITDFVGSDELVAHNAAFERSVIRQASQACGLASVQPEIVCTVKLAQTMLPLLENHRLPTVAAHLDVPLLNHHQALADATMCALIAQRLLTKAAPGTTLTQLAQACSRPQQMQLPL